ncbi:MAG: AI-2E family transporter [Planctomycetota bacterium]
MTDPDNRLRRRRLITLLVFLLLILAVVWGFRAVLMPFLVALFFAYLIDPLVNRITGLEFGGKFKLNRAMAIGLIYTVLIGALTVGVLFALPALGRQARQIQEDLPAARTWAEKTVQEAQVRWNELVGIEHEVDEESLTPAGPERARFYFKVGGVKEGVLKHESDVAYFLVVNDELERLPRDAIDHWYFVDVEGAGGFQQLLQQGVETVQSNVRSLLTLALGFLRSIIGAFTIVVLILMITAFLIIDRERIVRFLHELPPPRYQEKTERLLDYLDRGLAGVIRGQLMICLVNGVLTWLGLWLLGVRYATLLGLIAGIFSLIPIFGTIISTIPIVLIAWGAGDIQKAMLALGWILFIHFIEANFLNPKIMGGASKIHPVVVIFALLAGEHAYGVVGALLAVPTASLIQSAFTFFVIDRQAEMA